MKNNESNICHIPVSARFAEVNGEPVMISAEYADIPADLIAAYLVEKLGAGQIYKGGEENERCI